MKMFKNALKNEAKKIAQDSIDPRCWPTWQYQPKPPARILEQMQNKK